MEEAGDRVLLVAAVLPHQRGDGQKVRQVRNRRPLAHLRPVELDGPCNSLGKPPGWRRGHETHDVTGLRQAPYAGLRRCATISANRSSDVADEWTEAK